MGGFFVLARDIVFYQYFLISHNLKCLNLALASDFAYWKGLKPSPT
jgi:hypothetical protein